MTVQADKVQINRHWYEINICQTFVVHKGQFTYEIYYATVIAITIMFFFLWVNRNHNRNHKMCIQPIVERNGNRNRNLATNRKCE